MSRKLKRLFFVFAAAILFFSFFLKSQALENGPKYIIIFVADSLRPDHMGCYGYDKITTPFIDEKSEKALEFDNAFTTGSYTKPAVSSLLSGLYVFQHRVTRFERNGSSVISDVLPEDILTLPEVLKGLGFKTFGLYNCDAIQKEFGHGQGFDQYFEIPEKRFLEIFTKLFKRNKNRPLFFYLHFHSPHAPYEYDRKIAKEFNALNADKLKNYPFDRAIPVSYAKDKTYNKYRNLGECLIGYDREILWIDKQFKEIWGLLEAEDVLDSSLIIFLSDHGEEFLEHGDFGHTHAKIFEEMIRIPLIVWNFKHPPARVDKAVSIIDIYPTILAAVGYDRAGQQGAGIYGKDLFRAEEISEQRGVIAQAPTRDPAGKFYGFGEIVFRTKDKKIHLRNDVGNMSYCKIIDNREVGQEDGREFKKEKKVFFGFLNRIRYAYFRRPVPAVKEIKYSKEELEELKTLGYLQ